MKHSPPIAPGSPPASPTCRRAALLAVSCCIACTPLRDLSSYSEGALAAGAAAGGQGGVASAAAVASGAGLVGTSVGTAASRGGAPAPDAGAPEFVQPDVDASDAGPAPAPDACDAPDELALGERGCYRLAAGPESWEAASAACADWGGTLARIDTPEEEALLVQSLAAQVWLGLNDREVEGELRWDGGGALGTYANWAADQPDDFLGNEDCVELLVDGRGWNDRPCADALAYVCER